MKQLILISIICGLFISPLVFAEENHSARQIMDKVYFRSEANTRQAELTMTLTDSRGNQRIREITQFSKKMGEVEKSIMFFKYPADVKDTSFMSWSYSEAGRNDDQWIYLPALKKVKRISSDSKSDYFMGSDFTYDDLGDRHPADDTHKIIGKEEIDGVQCMKIESVPLDPDYQYSRVISWVADQKWLVLKKEFYDMDGDHLKSLNVIEYKNISGFWTILHSQMKNTQNDHSTDMRLQNVVLDAVISDRYFSERFMRRGIQ